MSALDSLVCVDPKRVHEIWSHVKGLLERAALRTGISSFQDIEYDVLFGDGLLWVAWDGSRIEAAATTVLSQIDDNKVCIITSCGGENMERWLPLLSQIESYAKSENCSCVRIYGRRGWMRVLREYAMRNVILERTL